MDENNAKDTPKINLTDDQRAAIYTRNKNIIVSAQAGAGKTFSLVKRILYLIEDDGYDIEKMLIVTFTNKAAAEMKDRIKKALGEAIKNTEDINRRFRLQKQYISINNAQISTMHSFCINVIRSYFYKIGKNPDFKIIADGNVNLIKLDAIEEVFEKYYREEDEEILNLIRDYNSGYSDDKIKLMILDLYSFLQSQKDPFGWYDYYLYNLWSEDMTDDELYAKQEKIRLDYIRKHLEKYISYINDNESYIKELSEKYPSVSKLYLNLIEDREIIQEISDFKTIKEVVEKTKFKIFPNLNRISLKKLPEEELAKNESVKQEISEIINEYREPLKYFFSTGILNDNIVEETREVYRNLLILRKILIDFDLSFKRMKNDKKGIDFSDAEHLTIELLKEDDVRKDLTDKFDFIFFDEYQDANRIQNYIVEQIARENNLFFVGDIKQSIYKFRLADPGIFNERYKNYNSEVGTNIAIDFKVNYRTIKEISYFNNFIFESLMTVQLAEIDYNTESHRLVPGVTDGVSKKDAIEVVYIVKDLNEKANIKFTDEIVEIKDRSLLRENPQTFYVAKKIKERIEAGENPKDFAILMRNSSLIQEVCDNLALFEIPFFSDSYSFDFENIEVKLFIEMLRAIDNDKNDLVLIAALKSVLGNFTEDELAEIRGDDKTASFSFLVYGYQENENMDRNLKNKISEYFSTIEKYRNREKMMSLSEFIYYVFVDSGYKSYILSQKNGKKKMDNILAFIEEVVSYEKDSDPGLYNFLNYLEKIKSSGNSYTPGAELSEEDNVVRIMTMHKSKGLEFKNVFLLRLDNKFNTSDLTRNYIYNNNLGVSVKKYIENTNTYRDNFLFEQIKYANNSELLAEESRLLYVAMTRAKEKLYLVGAVNLGIDGIEDVYTKGDFSSCNSHFKWINKVLLKDKISDTFKMENNISVKSDTDYFAKFDSVNNGVVFDLQKHSNLIIEKNAMLEERMIISGNDKKESFIDDFKKVLLYKYKNQEYVYLPYKKTVTELSGKNDNKSSDFKEYEKMFENDIKTDFSRPLFLENNKKLSAAEIGTLTHYVLRVLPFKKYTEDELRDKIAGLVFDEFITQEEAKYLSVEKLWNFYNSDILERIINSEKYYKEKSFTMKFSDGDKNFLVDGQVDVFFVENNEIVILDFKTDRSIEENRYRNQLNLYSQGLEKATNLKVKEKIIYWYNLGKFTKI